MIVGRTMWTQFTSVTDRQTDRETNGQNYDHKDRRASHGKNGRVEQEKFKRLFLTGTLMNIVQVNK